MKEGDVAGLAVWSNPYSFIGVKVVNGQKVYYEYEAREIGIYTTENGQKASTAEPYI